MLFALARPQHHIDGSAHGGGSPSLLGQTLQGCPLADLEVCQFIGYFSERLYVCCAAYYASVEMELNFAVKGWANPPFCDQENCFANANLVCSSLQTKTLFKNSP